MTPPLAPWTARILEILADGEWHTYDELAAAAGPLVPPGRAIRIAERLRSWHSTKRNATARPRARQWAPPLDTGRRAVVVAAIHKIAERQDHPLEFDGPHMARRVRMRGPR